MKNLRNLSDYRNMKTYEQRYESVLQRLARNVEAMLQDILNNVSHIDRINARAKSPSRFKTKSQKQNEEKKLKYECPLDKIQDQIGARVIVFYLDDVDIVSEKITGIFNKIEEKKLVPESESEFGYIGKHFVLFLPPDVIDDKWDDADIPTFFELQIKALYQHAWSEANHDLAYKANSELTSNQKRELAFTAAQSWGADEIFSRLSRSLETGSVEENNS